MNSTVGIALHIFHELVGIDVLKRLVKLDRSVELIITSHKQLSRTTVELAKKVSPGFQFDLVPNRGRDVEPFLNALSRFDACDYVVKLHSKDNSTLLKRAWYLDMVEAIIGSPEIFDAVVNAFDRNSWLRMVGPKDTWISAQKFMYGNREAVEKLQEVVYGKVDRSDWGFFAGTMFWYRRPVFSALRHFWPDAITFKEEIGANDGAPEHAMERFFGYYPSDVHLPVGMVSNTPNGPLIEYDIPPSMVAITRTIADKHKLSI